MGPKLHLNFIGNHLKTKVLRVSLGTHIELRYLEGGCLALVMLDGMGLTFLPDPNHEWDGNSLE
ncbi:hypothetical protein ACZ81_20630 (plasmid) [Alteromonas macleodii]|nr:hypothetical protein ACZ81_20630 [Alteromonas macleodii]